MKPQEITDIIQKPLHFLSDIITLLSLQGDEMNLLFKKAREIKEKHVGNEVYLRGLIEYSNICAKDCHYCGIRKSNHECRRYRMTDADVLEAVHFACKNNIQSIVIQSGELSSPEFVQCMTGLLENIRKYIGNDLGITLSCGEQSKETYERWKKAGATRYLLRIETTNRELYEKIHPKNKLHSFDSRLDALKQIQKCGFQTGTGVMIGLPGQTVEDLASDILFMHDMDIDMCGMGPYVESINTPLYERKSEIPDAETRSDLTLKMIAVLRIVMKDINIASTTALQTLNPNGKKNALLVGANVIMPNITPIKCKTDYNLYTGKPGSFNTREAELENTFNIISAAGTEPNNGKRGDSVRFLRRNNP
ncbi:MAG: [FeFe] hydrogenase H-cluster radical SAM maturase HydE [Bacteroidetes bacterium GWF2_38_335]|nr:MAG: [FeFe] hydrogenase H-cluster radical SAM maturase HydE [Bacteroidetes bacterium GWF2_38_335]OFY81190.1 MAG: [FeFe] hydrogenase H-cluster radical SAM maturase HydE [Bacteroidetes bacterium RIFOXYA12_FULL_38_20]HBS85305.1 [FeFe] hydrogenase H-cluster radical SAM maturase HydE [Bacteroidales bacterium]